jgi:hypothetical protein
MVAFPAGRFAVIVADPPWSFSTFSAKGKGRSPEAYYDCMGAADIMAMPVADWAAEDCVLLLWATDPLLPVALEVIHAWGFAYKTVAFYWAKLNKPPPPALIPTPTFSPGWGSGRGPPPKSACSRPAAIQNVNTPMSAS